MSENDENQRKLLVLGADPRLLKILAEKTNATKFYTPVTNQIGAICGVEELSMSALTHGKRPEIILPVNKGSVKTILPILNPHQLINDTVAMGLMASLLVKNEDLKPEPSNQPNHRLNNQVPKLSRGVKENKRKFLKTNVRNQRVRRKR